MLYYHLELFMPRVLEVSASRNLAGRYSFGNDFYPIWLTLKERPRDLYSTEVTERIQSGLFGRALDPRNPNDPLVEYRTFAYPAFTDLLFWPATAGTFSTVRIVMAVLLAGVTVVSVLFWMRALDWRPEAVWIVIVMLLTLGSYPVLEGLYADQLGLLVGFLLAGSLLALTRKRLVTAGVLMALTTIKPQMTVLMILYLLVWSAWDWQRRRRFCIGLFSMTAALVGTSLVVWPHWISSWLRVVASYHRYAKPPLVREVLAEPLGAAAAGPVTWAMILGLMAVSAYLVWRNRGAEPASQEFWITTARLLCITSITLLPGQAIHDHVILLPGIFLLAAQWRGFYTNWIGKGLVAIGTGILLWPWFAASLLVVLHRVLSAEQFYSKAIFALPLRTAAAFPFVILGLLGLARSDRLREKSLALESYRSG